MHRLRLRLIALLLCSTGALAQIDLLAAPAAHRSLAPNLAAGPAGDVYLSWIEPASDDVYAMRFARRTDAGWSAPRTIAEGDNWFVNWADFPSMAVLSNGSLAAHWLQKSGKGTYAYDVIIARSTDDGASWSEPFRPHRDGTATEHGFVSLLAHGDGALSAIWLDGREMKPGAHGHGNMTLRYARIAGDGEPSREAVLDPRVCECCQTSAALTEAGPIVAYRDRSDGEVRDIHVVRYVAGRWTAPRPVCEDGWQIHGCPVNGPSLAASGQRVAVAWFTAADDKARVHLASSHDGGATFRQPVRIDDGNPIGRAAVLLLDDGSAIVAWLERTEDGGELRVRRVDESSGRGEAVTVAPMGTSRRSGFPRMVRSGDRLVFAWTADTVRTAVMAIPE